MTRAMLLCLAAVLAVPALTTAQASSYTVYVNAIGPDKAILSDLKPEEFVVKENNKATTILSAVPATTPIKIALIVDDNGSGLFRFGLAGMMERLQGKAEFAVSVVTGQTMKLTDYTSDFNTLVAALGRLGVRAATNDGGQLIEAIYETARDLEKREARRAAIVVLTVGGPEQSTREGIQVLAQLQKSGAGLFVVETTSSSQRPGPAITNASDLLDGNMHLDSVLGDGPKQSGGIRLLFVSAGQANPQGLSSITNMLAGQYAITYALAPGQKPSGKLNVTSTRRGVTIVAPTRVPQR